MVDHLKPVFAKATARNSRYYISDNSLRSWLAALATPSASVNFRPIEDLVRDADARLEEAEGHGLEQLVALNGDDRIVRLGSCKRAAERLAPEFARLPEIRPGRATRQSRDTRIRVVWPGPL
jgi:hypothetical protein